MILNWTEIWQIHRVEFHPFYFQIELDVCVSVFWIEEQEAITKSTYIKRRNRGVENPIHTIPGVTIPQLKHPPTPPPPVLSDSTLTGCAWHTRAMSSLDAPYSIARAASLIISPATGATIWHPSSRSVSLSLRIFTSPSISAFVRARLLAERGNLPTL